MSKTICFIGLILLPVVSLLAYISGFVAGCFFIFNLNVNSNMLVIHDKTRKITLKAMGFTNLILKFINLITRVINLSVYRCVSIGKRS